VAAAAPLAAAATGRPPTELPALPPADENLHVVHYSSGLARDFPDSTPPVLGVLVEHFPSGEQTQFAAFTLAERDGSLGEFRTKMPELERDLLRSFNEFVAGRPGAVWIHWGMAKPGYGFDVIAQRSRLHGLTPADIPPARRFDLANYLKRRYGDNYVPDPRLWHAVRQNLGAVPNLLDDDAAAAAWQDGKYGRLLWSLSAKVGAIAKLFDRVRRGTFVVEVASPLTAKQREILAVLSGQALTLKELAERLGCDPSRLQRDHLKPLMERGLLANDSRVGGYYRPDAPPGVGAGSMAE
jgi:hypothetical protein